MKYKVLLIEDDRPTIEIYNEAFKIDGIDVEILDLGSKAIERIKEIKEGKREKPDLILLDLILPDIDGISVLEEAKKNPQTKDLKFIVLTNYSHPEVFEKLKQKGIEKILIKTDYTPHQLTKMIKEEIERKR